MVFPREADPVLTVRRHLDLGGKAPHRRGLFWNRLSIAASATVKKAYRVVGVTSTASARTVTIGSNLVKNGRVITIKDESGGANTNNITIATEGSANIDGASTYVMSANYESATIYSDGTNWFIGSGYKE